MAQSVLEGVAFSIRQGLELFDHPASKITLIGGGARERRWCRILCNVMGQKIFVYKLSLIHIWRTFVRSYRL